MNTEALSDITAVYERAAGVGVLCRLFQSAALIRITLQSENRFVGTLSHLEAF